MGRMVGFCDFLKAAALPLHIAQSAENIRKDGIEACGGNAGQIPFLYPRAVGHTTGRINGKTVIVNINVYLAAQYQIIAVDCTSQQILDTNHKKIYNKNLSVIQLHFYNATRDIE